MWKALVCLSAMLLISSRVGLSQDSKANPGTPKTSNTKPGLGDERKGQDPSKASSPQDPRAAKEEQKADAKNDKDSFQIEPGSRSETELFWKKKTPGMAYKVMRQHGTESKFSGKYTRSKAKGIYRCAGCGAILFSSDQKFESGTGWPSFWAPLAPMNVAESVDTSLPSETRTEIHCAACNGHLGHVFADGPQPTGLRYCLNSVALKLDESDHAKKLMKEGAPSAGKEKRRSEKQQ